MEQVNVAGDINQPYISVINAYDNARFVFRDVFFENQYANIVAPQLSTGVLNLAFIYCDFNRSMDLDQAPSVEFDKIHVSGYYCVADISAIFTVFGDHAGRLYVNDGVVKNFVSTAATGFHLMGFNLYGEQSDSKILVQIRNFIMDLDRATSAGNTTVANSITGVSHTNTNGAFDVDVDGFHMFNILNAYDLANSVPQNVFWADELPLRVRWRNTQVKGGKFYLVTSTAGGSERFHFSDLECWWTANTGTGTTNKFFDVTVGSGNPMVCLTNVSFHTSSEGSAPNPIVGNCQSSRFHIAGMNLLDPAGTQNDFNVAVPAAATFAAFSGGLV